MSDIVHITSQHPTLDVRIFQKECLTLAKSGYKVSLIAPHEQDEIIKGVNVISIPKEKSRYKRMVKGLQTIYHKAVLLDADIYHFHDPELIFVGLLLRLKGKRVIYDVHEDNPNSLLARKSISPWKRQLLSRIFDVFERQMASRFSAVIAAYSAIESRFVGKNPNVVVLNNYAILNEFFQCVNSDWEQRENIAAYVGILAQIRGIEQMVDAMNYVNPSFHSTLELAGVFNDKDFRERVICSSGWKYVRERGFLSREKVGELFSNVKAGLVLFLPEPNHIRTQPNKFYEYMAAGLPVVVSDFPMWRKLIDGSHCGLVVNPENPKAIAQALEFIYLHPAEAQNMGKRGREAVTQLYNWESESRKLLNLYSDLLSKK